MKFNVLINQAALSRYEKLDMVDAAILDWLKFFCNSKNPKIEQKRLDGMTWIDYSQIINDMPLVRIKTKSGISRRLTKLRDAGFIRTHLEEGYRTYISLTEKMDELEVKSSEMDKVAVSHKNRYRKATPPFPNGNATVACEQPTIILDTNTSTNSNSIELQDFSFEKELIKLRDSTRKDHKIIALYWRKKGYAFENQHQLNSALKRELRAAQSLKGYTGEQIAKSIGFCEKKYDTWTLESVGKRIADINNKK